MARASIRNEGKGAELRFLTIVKGSRLSTEAKRGDVTVDVDNESNFVEIKECHKDSINQIRAMKFITLVVYSPQFSKPWAVIPPHEVIRIVATKTRGQHTEVAFECANLSVKRVSEEFRCSDEELEERVIRAIREGKKYHDLKKVMDKLHEELSELSQRVRSEVADVISRAAKES